MEKTILVAIDGSVYSANSLDYLARLFAADSSLHLHLLAVAPSGGAGKEWMFDVDPHRSPTAGSDQRTQQAHRHLREAGERLQRAGVSAERIQARVRVATGGIGATIRDEAERGSYDSLVIGRRGLGGVGSMLFGSTSGELVEKCQRVPLWIVDGKVSSHRFLLAVHCQPDHDDEFPVMRDELSGAVQRIQTPKCSPVLFEQFPLLELGHLLAQQRDVGCQGRQHPLQALLHREVGFRHHAAVRLVAGLGPGETRQ